jgi:hypothetical protein
MSGLLGGAWKKVEARDGENVLAVGLSPPQYFFILE